MLTRNRVPAEIRWLLLDAAHRDYASVLALLRSVHEDTGRALSVNTRNDGSQSLVKLLGPVPVLPAGILLRTYTDADHSSALALVSTRATALDASAGWLAPGVP